MVIVVDIKLQPKMHPDNADGGATIRTDGRNH
jgi:hypothetical protein